MLVVTSPYRMVLKPLPATYNANRYRVLQRKYPTLTITQQVLLVEIQETLGMWFVMMATEEAETGGVIHRQSPATVQLLKVDCAVSVRVKQLSRIPATKLYPLEEDAVKTPLQRAMLVMEMKLILDKAKWSGRVTPMLKGTTNSLDRRA